MKNFLVDSHCHLNYEGLYERLDEVITEADSNNVKILQTICTRISEIPILKNIAKQHSNIFYSIGVHPLNIHKNSIPSVDELIALCNDDKKISGIGETGLDYYKSTNHSMQKESFENHIQAAQETNLPIIVHTRDAEENTYEILARRMKMKTFTGVLHCFTGSYDLAKKAVSLGLYISASGIITFKNAENIRSVFAQLPMNKILIETDSPYLAPVPYRGKINQPSYVVEVAKEIARIKNMHYDDIIKITTNNFLTLFNRI